ncbi:MAG TPA: AAA family ATPase [Halomicronema sp.]
MINWTEIFSEYPCLETLRNCPQNPLYHAEGDVLTHTKMVVETLVSLTQWQQLSENEKNILFTAALLHDIGKPITTTIDENGIITSRGHGRKGTQLARYILYQKNTPFWEREKIVSLIQNNGLPLWFWDKENPQREIIKASQNITCEWLAILAEADIGGRICTDQQELFERITFFREYCQENNCLTKPWQFPDSYSRFIYFHKDKTDPNYQAFDDSRCQVILMAGLPASGKDTWIENNLSNFPEISLDKIRKELNNSPEKNQAFVVNLAKKRAKDYLRKQQSFVWNATNTTRQMRQQLIEFFTDYKAKIRLIYLEAPLQELLNRNSQRNEPVPEDIIEKLASRLEIPRPTEAHEVQWVIQ